MTTPPKKVAPGNPFGKFQIETLLARGMVSETWLAIYQGIGDFNKEVVLKILRRSWASDVDFVRLFFSQALAAANLAHPNIAGVFDLGEEEGLPFLAMEHFLGRSLRQVMQVRATQGIPIWVVLHAINELLGCLNYAHEFVDEEHAPEGLFHQEVAPENIVISKSGQVQLLDLGVARATAFAPAGAATLTHGYPAYCAPEQAQAGEIDARSDLYAVGVVLYELLVGQKPYRAETKEELLELVIAGECPPPGELKPGIPADLEQIILRAMKADPAARYQTAREMKADLITASRVRGQTYLPEDLADYMDAAVSWEAHDSNPHIELLGVPPEGADMDGQPTPVVDMQSMAGIADEEYTPIVDVWQQAQVLNSVEWDADQDEQALNGISNREARPAPGGWSADDAGAKGQPDRVSVQSQAAEEPKGMESGPGQEDSLSRLWRPARRPGPDRSMAAAWDAPVRAGQGPTLDPWQKHQDRQAETDPFAARTGGPSQPPGRSSSRPSAWPDSPPVEQPVGGVDEESEAVRRRADLFHQLAVNLREDEARGNVFAASRPASEAAGPSHTEYAFIRKRPDREASAPPAPPLEVPRPPVKKPTPDTAFLARREPPSEEVRARRHFEAGFEALRQGRRDLASSEWEHAIALEPQNKLYQFNLKRLLGDDALAGDIRRDTPGGDSFPWGDEE